MTFFGCCIIQLLGQKLCDKPSLISNELFIDQNGPSTFDNASKMYAESPHSVPDAQVPPSRQGMHNQSFSSPEQNVRLSQAAQNLPTQFSSVSNVASPISQPGQRFSGMIIPENEQFVF